MTIFLMGASFFLALILDSMPLAPMLDTLRPDFLMLLLIYWGMAAPAELGMTVAWVLGLLQDAVSHSAIGAHALGAVVLLYALQKGSQRFRGIPPWEQIVFVFALLFAERLIAWVWQGWSGSIALEPGLVLGPVAGALLWPPTAVLVDRIRRMRIPR